MFFENPEILNKVYEVLNKYSVKFPAFLVNIQTLSIATQAFPLQPIPEHPNLLFAPLKKSHPLLNFVYKLIELFELSQISFMSFSHL